MTKEITLNYDDFIDQFQPIKNPLRENAPFDEAMFETYGEELDFVLSQPLEKIWTIVQGDNGYHWVLSGYCIVNRLGYFVTEKPHPKNSHIEIPLDEDSEMP